MKKPFIMLMMSSCLLLTPSMAQVVVNDPVATVRMEVAMQNYGLMKLIHDPSTVVRDCAEKQLRKRAAEQNLPKPKFSRPKTKGKVR